MIYHAMELDRLHQPETDEHYEIVIRADGFTSSELDQLQRRIKQQYPKVAVVTFLTDL